MASTFYLKIDSQRQENNFLLEMLLTVNFHSLFQEATVFHTSSKFPNGTVLRGEWVLRPPHKLPPPECRETDWSRDNHLGNGVGGFPNTYNWTLPNLNEESCTLRIR